jgi:thymidylate kinase
MIIAIDGCKGVGKTTLLDSMQQELTCTVIAEAKEDPFRCKTLELLSGFGTGITRGQELMLLERFCQGRASMVKDIVSAESITALVLLDRWYLTDFAFRKHLGLHEVLEASRLHDVLKPDLYIVLTCEPSTAWERLSTRQRGLDSRSVTTLHEWVRINERFIDAADRIGGMILRTDTKLEASKNALRSILESKGAELRSRDIKC